MTPRDRELITGMGNCYEACHADCSDTLGMVAGARHLTVDEVRERLLWMGRQHASDPEYLRLRARFPAEFPV
ncbi:MAG: hypothetical protein L3K09_08440 [Thermoplasmata archaeon]|nr:hypothetical protein [Thermoplasmata archaeon]